MRLTDALYFIGVACLSVAINFAVGYKESNVLITLVGTSLFALVAVLYLYQKVPVTQVFAQIFAGIIISLLPGGLNSFQIGENADKVDMVLSEQVFSMSEVFVMNVGILVLICMIWLGYQHSKKDRTDT